MGENSVIMSPFQLFANYKLVSVALHSFTDFIFDCFIQLSVNNLSVFSLPNHLIRHL